MNVCLYFAKKGAIVMDIPVSSLTIIIFIHLYNHWAFMHLFLVVALQLKHWDIRRALISGKGARLMRFIGKEIN